MAGPPTHHRNMRSPTSTQPACHGGTPPVGFTEHVWNRGGGMQRDVWVHPTVAVERSAIEGRGLFATAPLAAGELVMRLGGRVVTRSSCTSFRRHAGRPVRRHVRHRRRRPLVLPSNRRALRQPQLRSHAVGGRRGRPNDAPAGRRRRGADHRGRRDLGRRHVRDDVHVWSGVVRGRSRARTGGGRSSSVDTPDTGHRGCSGASRAVARTNRGRQGGSLPAVYGLPGQYAHSSKSATGRRQRTA